MSPRRLDEREREDSGWKALKNWDVRGKRRLPHEMRYERAKGRDSVTVVACEMGLKSADAATWMWKNAWR